MIDQLNQCVLRRVGVCGPTSKWFLLEAVGLPVSQCIKNRLSSSAFSGVSR